MRSETRYQQGPRRRGSGTNCGLRPPPRRTNHREGSSTSPRDASDHPRRTARGTIGELARAGPNHHQRIVKLLARRTLILLRASASQTQRRSNLEYGCCQRLHPSSGNRLGDDGRNVRNLFRLACNDTTEIIMVRHAEPDYSATNGTHETPDPPLTERGRCQAARLAKRLRATQIDAIYSSTMRRAIETADIAAAANDLAVIRTPQLREVAIGPRVLNNGTKEDPKKLASEVLVRFLNNPR